MLFFLIGFLCPGFLSVYFAARYQGVDANKAMSFILTQVKCGQI